MFTIKYRIIDGTVQELKDISLDEFIRIFDGDIEGQIELNFNGKIIGFVNKEVNVAVEWLIWWFTLLNETIYELNKLNSFKMDIPETDGIYIWLEVEEDLINVRKVKGRSNFSNDEINEVEQCEWDNIKISKDEFINSIIRASDSLIKEIYNINYRLLEAESIKNLKRIIKQNYNYASF